MAAPSAPAASHNDVEKVGVFATAVAAGSSAGDQWGKNMQRWRNDNIDIAKGSWVLFPPLLHVFIFFLSLVLPSLVAYLFLSPDYFWLPLKRY